MDANQTKALPTFFGAITGLVLLSILLPACDEPTFDLSTPEGKRAIIELTNQHLSAGDCAGAITEIEPLYKSANTDNEVRMIAASAYACKANVNFFKLIGDLTTNATALAGDGFWSLMAKLFPSSMDLNDRTVEGALLATDALMAVIKPGAVILPGDYVNEGTFNPGAAIASDRLDDADIYLLFINMAAIGALENRYGNPDSTTHVKTNPLPWTTAHSPGITSDGCAFGAAIIQLADNLEVVASLAQGSVQTGISDLKSFVQQKIYDGCEQVCENIIVPHTTCPRCPMESRDRSKCAGTDNDPASEIAAGLTQLVNTRWVVPVP